MVKVKKTGSDPDGKVVFEAPLANLKGGWLELIKTQIINCSNAILQQEDGKTEKFHFSFLLLLNLLPGGKDGKKRHRVYDMHTARLKKRLEEGGGNLTNAQQTQIRQESEMQTLGEITDFVDKYIGIQEKLSIDRTVCNMVVNEEEEEGDFFA